MKFDPSRTNYDVDSIERSIVMDNEVGSLPLETKQKLYDEAMEKLRNYPELMKILDIRHLHSYSTKDVGMFERIGILPSKLVISDDRIKDMCRLPFWYPSKNPDAKPGEMKFGPCPNLGKHSSCPGYSPTTKEVRAKLNESDIFVVLQTIYVEVVSAHAGYSGWRFRPLHRLEKEINSLLGEGAVTQRFGEGPCNACAQQCLGMGECRQPHLYTAALESQGVPVGQLTRDLAYFSGDKSWDIEFLKHFGMPNQTPKKWKHNVALSIKLPSV